MLVLACCVLGSILVAAGLHEIVSHSQQIRERDWINAAGSIEDVRGVLVAQANGIYGSAMLYNVEVLASYPLHGSVEKRWVRVGERPTDWSGVELSRRKWQGRHCLVLVNPNNREQVQVELLRE